MTTLSYGIRDNSGEMTYVAIPVEQMDASNHDTIVAAQGDMNTALDVIILGNLANRSIAHSRGQMSPDRPTDPYANRETAVRFVLKDPTNPSARFSVSVGTPDLSKFPFADAGKDLIEAPFTNLHTDVAAWVSFLEDHMVDPATENNLTVTSMEQIGRNL